MTEHHQDPEPDSKIVAHIGHVPENVHLEDIHLRRLEREERRRNLQWMVIIVVLSLLATGLALWLGGFWGEFETSVPGYEPKGQSRQQQMGPLERDRPKEAP